MLHELADYAEREGLHAEAGFTRKDVRWLIVFDAAGRFLNVIPQGDGRRGRTFPKVPHLKFSGDTPMRQFLVDTAQYALLYKQDPADRKRRAKHEYFLGLLRAASEADPAFGTPASALADDSVREGVCQRLDEQTPAAKPADNVTFAIADGAGGMRVLVEEAGWHDWWRSYFPTLFGERKASAERLPCLISGQLVEPAPTHPKIKGLGGVGGKVETTLVAFNEPAFRSYGLEQSHNAPVGKEAAERYAAALNDLIERHSVTLAGTKIVYWYVGDQIPTEDEDPLRLLLGGEVAAAGDLDDTDEPDEAPDSAEPSKREVAQAQSRAHQLLQAIRSGARPDLRACQYRALTLSGNSARVVVRDWMEGQFEELAANVDRWFDDLAVVRRDGAGLAARPKFAAVIAAIVRELGDAPPPLVQTLWHVAVKGQAIPHQLMTRTLMRVRTDIIDDKAANHARMGLLRAFCIRNGDIEMHATLNENHPEPAYHCGRLLAVLAYIQWKALGDVGAGVVQRYYAAASATPALVLGRLMRTAQFHLDKIPDKGTRLGLDNRLAEIWSQIRDHVPTTLTLEQQTIFALGYYHQKAYRGPGREGEAAGSDVFVPANS